MVYTLYTYVWLHCTDRDHFPHLTCVSYFMSDNLHINVDEKRQTHTYIDAINFALWYHTQNQTRINSTKWEREREPICKCTYLCHVKESDLYTMHRNSYCTWAWASMDLLVAPTKIGRRGKCLLWQDQSILIIGNIFH